MLEEEIAKVARLVEGRIKESLEGDGGPLYRAASHLPLQGGKRMRPFMVVKSCEAVGGRAKDALAAATAIELLHNFTLVHDDIMDNDLLRRGVPTVHALFGTPLAILAGDLLFAKSLNVLLSSGGDPEKIRGAAETLTRATVTLSEGQYMDMAFEGRTDVREEEYLDMVYRKTAALFQAGGEMGAILGGGGRRETRLLGECGRSMGIGFQIYDDYLGMTSSEEVLGKSVGNDIREGKKTLLVARALQTPARGRVLGILGKKNASEGEVASLVETMRKEGVLDYVLQSAKRCADLARGCLLKIPDSAARAQLLELVDYSVKRKK